MTSVLTSSTSGSTGTGLKKCKPSTRPGLLVAAAIFMIGMLDVFDASTASGSVIDLVQFGEDLGLDGLVLDDRLDDQLAVGQVGQIGGELQLRQRRVALPLGDLARADAALERLDDAGAARGGQRLGRLVDEHVDTGPRATPRRCRHPSARRR